MKAETYKPEHFEEMQDWWKHYNLKLNEQLLPATGVVVPGMAAGFIYLTNSPQAWIENLVKNPHLDKETSNKALDLVIDGLFQIGFDNGAKCFVCETIFDSVKIRAMKHNSQLDPNKYTRLYRSF